MLEERLEVESIESDESSLPWTAQQSAIVEGGNSSSEAGGVTATTTDTDTNPVGRSDRTPSITLTLPIGNGHRYTTELHPARDISQHRHSDDQPPLEDTPKSQSTSNQQRAPSSETAVPVATNASANNSRRCGIGTIFEESMDENSSGSSRVHSEGEDSMNGLSQFTSSKKKSRRKHSLKGWLKIQQEAISSMDWKQQRSNSYPEQKGKMYSLFDKMNKLVAIDGEMETNVEMEMGSKQQPKMGSVQDSDGQMPSVYTVSDVVRRAKQWKKKTCGVKQSANEQDGSGPKNFGERVKKRALTELPRSLHLEILTESLPVLHKTLQMYQGTLGCNHPLSLKTAQRIQQVETQLGMSRDQLQFS